MTPFIRHSIYIAASALGVLAVYFLLYAKPLDSIRIEAGEFGFDNSAWVVLEDVNFSESSGIMTRVKDSAAAAAFNVPADGEYTVWLKYFGNYGPRDMALWKRAYTNQHGYVDYFGAGSPLDMAVRVDGEPAKRVAQGGSHRYRWGHVGTFAMKKGGHTLSVWKPDESPGAITIDAALISPDKSYAPGRIEALPRQISEYFAPILIAVFPLSVWLYSRRRGPVLGRRTRENEEAYMPPGADRGHAAVYLAYSIVLASLLSVMWIDTDGGFWIWLTQSADFTAGKIYTSGDALHHRYVYPPPIALMLIGLRPIFSLFGAMDGITPLSLLLSKAVVFPFVVGTGLLLLRLEGRGAMLLWALNSLVIFTVAAHSMYFGLAFILTLCLYFIKTERPYACALTLGAGLAYMSATMLLVPPFLLLLRSAGGVKKPLLMAGLVLVPGFLVLAPYNIIDPAGVNARVMGAGISTWMSMHLGMRLGDIGITSFMYGAGLAYLWVKKPAFEYENLAAVFALTGLIYLNIGAPYFLAWAVAFQPFIIVWAVRNSAEFFYSIYVTVLMAWGSFFQSTGGGLDRAGETGFFPYYVFYAWPFDVFAFLRIFYRRIDYFSQAELEALSHSLSAGVSAILLVLIARRFMGFEKKVFRQNEQLD